MGGYPCVLFLSFPDSAVLTNCIAEYKCPHCGHFNPSARAIRSGAAPRSPLTAMQTPITPVRGGVPMVSMPFQPPARVPPANGAAPPQMPSVPESKLLAPPAEEASASGAETPSKKARKRKEGKKEAVMEGES